MQFQVGPGRATPRMEVGKKLLLAGLAIYCTGCQLGAPTSGVRSCSGSVRFLTDQPRLFEDAVLGGRWWVSGCL